MSSPIWLFSLMLVALRVISEGASLTFATCWDEEISSVLPPWLSVVSTFTLIYLPT